MLVSQRKQISIKTDAQAIFCRKLISVLKMFVLYKRFKHIYDRATVSVLCPRFPHLFIRLSLSHTQDYHIIFDRYDLSFFKPIRLRIVQDQGRTASVESLSGIGNELDCKGASKRKPRAYMRYNSWKGMTDEEYKELTYEKLNVGYKSFSKLITL